MVVPTLKELICKVQIPTFFRIVSSLCQIHVSKRMLKNYKSFKYDGFCGNYHIVEIQRRLILRFGKTLNSFGNKRNCR
ncbi:hypothetical protein LEP1GSC080_4184 [Leptospira interrogans str. FPW2026]|nr:hypothetical protein LEP1GSC080_4184 [Leptospira interrogans str. FPW2026]